METLENKFLCEMDIQSISVDSLNEEEFRLLKTMEHNIQDLKRIQFIYLMEEDKNLTLDQVLARVLSYVISREDRLKPIPLSEMFRKETLAQKKIFQVIAEIVETHKDYLESVEGFKVNRTSRGYSFSFTSPKTTKTR